MATTTNFGWETPDDTDLVKDGAAAMRTLGNSIDTSFVDLKGGTTGQVLSKASGTDLDFTWVAQDDSNAIQNAIVDAKGDLIVGASADTPARLAVGTNGYVLTANSSATNGVEWAAASSAANYTLINSGGTALSGSSTVTVSSISGKNDLYIFASGVTGGDGNSYGTITMRFNTDTGSNYEYVAAYDMIQNTSTNPFIGLNAKSASATSIALGGDKTPVTLAVRMSGANASGIKPLSYNCIGTVGNDYMSRMSGHGAYKGTSTISSVSLICSGNFTAGTIYVYGA